MFPVVTINGRLKSEAKQYQGVDLLSILFFLVKRERKKKRPLTDAAAAAEKGPPPKKRRRTNKDAEKQVSFHIPICTCSCKMTDKTVDRYCGGSCGGKEALF